MKYILIAEIPARCVVEGRDVPTFVVFFIHSERKLTLN